MFFQLKVAYIKKCIVGKLSKAARNGFRYEMYRKFATGSGGFESNLNFELSGKFHWGPPFAEL